MTRKQSVGWLYSLASDRKSNWGCTDAFHDYFITAGMS